MNESPARSRRLLPACLFSNGTGPKPKRAECEGAASTANGNHAPQAIASGRGCPTASAASHHSSALTDRLQNDLADPLEVNTHSHTAPRGVTLIESGVRLNHAVEPLSIDPIRYASQERS